MKKIIYIILVSFAITNFCFAETNENEIPPPTIISVEDNNEELEKLENVIPKSNNMETVVYIHPISLAWTALAIRARALGLFVTIEKPLSLSNSLIVKPSLFVNFEWGLHDFGTDKMDRFGSDVGIRYYPSGKGEGLYLQPQGGIFHFKGEYDTKVRIVGDGMIYLGYSEKSIVGDFKYFIIENINLFVDIGLGYGSTPWGWGSDAKSTRIIFDVNFCIGMKF